MKKPNLFFVFAVCCFFNVFYSSTKVGIVKKKIEKKGGGKKKQKKGSTGDIKKVAKNVSSNNKSTGESSGNKKNNKGKTNKTVVNKGSKTVVNKGSKNKGSKNKGSKNKGKVSFQGGGGDSSYSQPNKQDLSKVKKQEEQARLKKEEEEQTKLKQQEEEQAKLKQQEEKTIQEENRMQIQYEETVNKKEKKNINALNSLAAITLNENRNYFIKKDIFDKYLNKIEYDELLSTILKKKLSIGKLDYEFFTSYSGEKNLSNEIKDVLNEYSSIVGNKMLKYKESNEDSIKDKKLNKDKKLK
jgi:hypothetical protein